MKHLLVATSCVATLAGCMTDTVEQATTDPASFTPISTRAEFVRDVAGRNIAEGESGFFVMNSDGTLEGVDVENNAYTGTWNWQNGAWCRAFDRPEGPTTSKCRSIAVNDAQIRFTKVENGEIQFYRWQ